MNLSAVVLLSILFCRSLTQDTSVEERKKNMVVNILDKVLEDIISDVTSKNMTIPLVDLGEFGRFEKVTVSVPKMSKATDGVGSYGFKLQTNVSEILATGYYDIKDLDIPGLFPVFGKGNFAIAVEAVNLNLNVKAVYNFADDKFDLSIVAFDVNVMDSKVKFENLMGDPYVSDFLNELIGNLIPQLVQAFLPPLSSLLQPLLDFYGNGIIKCIKTEIKDLENCIKNLFETVAGDIFQRLTRVC